MSDVQPRRPADLRRVARIERGTADAYEQTGSLSDAARHRYRARILDAHADMIDGERRKVQARALGWIVGIAVMLASAYMLVQGM